MDSMQLRGLQAPLKERYRQAPEFHLDSDEPQDRVDTLIKLTGRYCVIQTLAGKPGLSVSV